MNKKIIFTIILGILLISCVSAFRFSEIDNIKNYNEIEKEIIVRDSILWLFPTDNILSARLETPQIYRVGLGYQKVAQFTIQPEQNYEEVLGKFDFYDLNKNNKKIEKQIDIKYFNEKNKKWEEFRNNLKFDEKIKIGIFTNVKEGDRIEWIPKIAGIKINEWAVWEGSLNTDLFAYYDFNQESGNIITNNFNSTFMNLTITGGVVGENYSFGTGVFNNALVVGEGISGGVGNGIKALSGWNNSGLTGITFNFWTNRTGAISGSGDYGVASIVQTGNGNSVGDMRIAFNNDEMKITVNQNSTSLVYDLNSTSNLNQWEMWTGIINATGQFLYRNGTFVQEIQNQFDFGAGDYFPSFFNDQLGHTPLHNTTIDEFSIFNRTLTSSEISTLWDSGTGTFYGLSVSLNAPADNYVSPNKTIPFNCSGNSGLGILNLTLRIDGINNYTIKNTSANQNGLSLSESRNVSVGDHNWTCHAEDSSSSLTATLRDFSYIPFNSNNESYYNYSLETSKQTFQINLTSTSGYTVSNGRLVYNNTVYSNANKLDLGSGVFSLSKSIYIPVGTSGFSSENRSFYWNVSLTEESTGKTFSFTTSSHNQTVNELIFRECNATNINITMLNFTLYDELTNTLLNSTANATSFQATFILGADSSNRIKNYSINNLSVDKNNFAFCTDNSTRTIYADMSSIFSAVDYAERNYYIYNSTLTNATNNIILYLIPDSDALEFFISITQGLRAVVGANIQVAKYFTGIGSYKTIEIDQTDSNGEFNVYLDLDRDYRAVIIQDGTILGTKYFRSSCATAPCEIDLNIEGDTEDMFDLVNNLYAQNVAYNLSFNYTSKMVTFDFTDITGLAHYFRMAVYNSNSSSDADLISNQTLYTSSGTLTFNATNYEGQFIVKTYVSRSPEILLPFVLNFLIEEFYEALGDNAGEMLLLCFLVIITFIFGLAFKPSILILSIPIIMNLAVLSGILPVPMIVVIVFYIFAILAMIAIGIGKGGGS